MPKHLASLNVCQTWSQATVTCRPVGIEPGVSKEQIQGSQQHDADLLFRRLNTFSTRGLKKGVLRAA